MNSNLTQAELAALQCPISNDCRVLYLLGLRVGANTATTSSAPIDYKHLLNLPSPLPLRRSRISQL